MRAGSVIIIVVAALGLALSGASFIIADQVRYMDSSGNIRFVKRPSDVPKQYILQVFTPTPTPYYDKRALAEMKRRKAMAEAERRREEMNRQRDIRRQEMLLQQEQAKEARRLRAEDDAARIKRGGR